ncbi:MAG: DUF4143 domain-containing protein [Clostridiales bacterium]|jgi:predicted AAA+ superfamily ATPase|nr:DUF4143 domain-containing protein [Clostridiales bacterium]
MAGCRTEDAPFPEGKVDFCHLRPMTFLEFLEGIREGSHAMQLRGKIDWMRISYSKSRYVDLLRNYFYVGGMPGVVAEYAKSGDYAKARGVQEWILTSIENDFAKRSSNIDISLTRSAWRSIPAQLSRKNKKFSPGVVKKMTRYSDYESALQWLQDCGLIHKCRRVVNPPLLPSSQKDKDFKIYMLDIGLLGAALSLDARVLLDGNRIFEGFKGALMEQYISQETVACGIEHSFWRSIGTAEVDFVLRRGKDICPLEVHVEENLQSKSLSVYKEMFEPTVSYRTSLQGYRDDGWMVHVPLYAIGAFLNEYPEISKRRG